MDSLLEVTRAEQSCRFDFDECRRLVNWEKMAFVLGALGLGYLVSVSHRCLALVSSPVVYTDCIQGSLTDADSVV